jgi:hypothetical protein
LRWNAEKRRVATKHWVQFFGESLQVQQAKPASSSHLFACLIFFVAFPRAVCRGVMQQTLVFADAASCFIQTAALLIIS